MSRTAEATKVGETPRGDDRPDVSWSVGEIRLVDPRLFAVPDDDPCRDFLRRAFDLAEVRSVEVDPARGSAVVRYDPAVAGVDVVLGRLAAAVRGRDDAPGLGAVPAFLGNGAKVKVSRHGSALSTWEVVHELPGRLRLRNEGMGPDVPRAQRIARELAAVHGVESCGVKPFTASLLVRHDPAVIGVRQILLILDHLIEGSELPMAHAGGLHAVPFGLANASIGLAVLGEFAVPALLPASALLLVASNAGTIRAAWDEIRDRKPGLPVLSTTVITATLASGQFVAAALMGWMLKFWRHRHREQHQATRRRLLPGMVQHRRFARLVVGDAEVEVTLERLRPGDPVSVRAGEVVPADGRVARGGALVDDRPVRGGSGLTPKRAGDPVFAGTRAVSGELVFEVAAVGASTRAAALASAVLSAASPDPSRFALSAHGETFARRAVVPTLATAGLGLLVGDLTTAAAVLRPDYATGPGLGVSQQVLQDLAACARDGVFVRDAAAFGRLAESDLVLIDDHPDLGRSDLDVDAVGAPGVDTEGAVLRYAAAAFRDLDDDRSPALRAATEARGLAPLDVTPEPGATGITFRDGARGIRVESEAGPGSPLTVAADGGTIGRVAFRPSGRLRAVAAVAALRESGARGVGLLSGRPDAAVATLAGALGIDDFRGDLSPRAKADVLRTFRERGLKVTYVGERLREQPAAREAHAAISLDGEFAPETDPAAAVMLPGDLGRVAGLRALSKTHVARVRSVHGMALIPNLVCIAGAFLFGFTSLSAVVVTNLGILGVYSGLPHRSRLRYPSVRR